jgi:mono/diheme cytochrome c family protein
MKRIHSLFGAPRRMLLWVVVGVFILCVIAGVVIFRTVLTPGQQARVMDILPMMEVFLPPRPDPGATLPTAQPVDPEVAESLLFGPLDLSTEGEEVTPEAEETPEATEEAAAEMGREVYLRACAECHGESGEGYANELAAPALDASEHAWHHPDQQIYGWIVDGKLGLERSMPPLGDQLTHDEVLAVIEYLHTLWTDEQLTTQQDITERYPVTLEPRQGP